MKEITIFGGGGHCFALIELIREGKTFTPTLVLDKTPNIDSILGVPVRLREDNVFHETYAAIAIGNNIIRKKIAENIAATYPNFVHGSAVCYPTVNLGNGVQILPNAVVDAAVTIGNFTIINNNATVSHNTDIGDFCHIAINAAVSGGCTIGEGTLVGAGSVLLPNITIGKWVTIGAGAIVTKDVPDGVTVVGNPARILA